MVYFQNNYYNYYYLWLEINHFEVERGNKKNIERKLSITDICKLRFNKKRISTYTDIFNVHTSYIKF